MSRLDAVRSANLADDAPAILCCSASEDFSPFFGTDESDALQSSGVLEQVLNLMLLPAFADGPNPVLDKLREDFLEEELCVYVSVSDPTAAPVLFEDLDEEDFEEDGETVRADRYTSRLDPEMIAELDFDDTLDHPAMEVMDYFSGSYDHKRKYLDISAEINLTVGRLLQLSDADLSDWTIKVTTSLGMTEIEHP